MNKIINILVKRDGITREEAQEMVKRVQDMIILNPTEAIEIIQDELYLEPDYLEDLFNY